MNRLIRIAFGTFVIMTAFTILSCSGTGTGSEVSDQPIKNANASIIVNAIPDFLTSGVSTVSNTTNGKANYIVSAIIVDVVDPPNSYVNAQITVNGILMAPSINTGKSSSFIVKSGIVLGEGDTVSVTIKHKLLGTITGSTIVPSGVSSFTLNPILPSPGVAFGQTTSCTMNWTDNGSNAYYAIVSGYDSNDTFIQSSTSLASSSSYKFSSEKLISKSTETPYLMFSLAAVNTALFAGYKTNSGLYVDSVDISQQSNLP